MAKAKREGRPFEPPEYDETVAYAIKALHAGTAGDHQQKLALQWILDCAGLRDLSFRPGSPDETAFAEGKRFVGLQIAKMIEINIEAARGNRAQSRD